MYLREGKWSEAIPQFQKALAIAPDSPTYSNLGTAYFWLKNYDQVDEDVRKSGRDDAERRSSSSAISAMLIAGRATPIRQPLPMAKRFRWPSRNSR